MTVLRALLALTLIAAAPAAAAQSQAWQPRPGEPALDPHRRQVDQHRHEIDRLRARHDRRAAYARQTELETRLNRQSLERARQPEPVQPPPLRALRPPGEERALRRPASERRAATTSQVTQIDAWLDRPRD